MQPRVVGELAEADARVLEADRRRRVAEILRSAALPLVRTISAHKVRNETKSGEMVWSRQCRMWAGCATGSAATSRTEDGLF